MLGLVVALGGCASAAAVPSAPGRQALLSHLALLRRPAGRADSSPALRSELKLLAAAGCDRLVADPSLIRLAAVTPIGTRVYVVAFRPAACVPHCTGTARTCIRQLPREETVAVIAEQQFPQIATLADLEAGRAVAGLTDPATHRFWGFMLVPDGVAGVVLRLFGQGRPYELSVPVRSNLAVFDLQAPPAAPSDMLWLDRDRHVLRRIVATP
jgi:hypothetical protein